MATKIQIYDHNNVLVQEVSANDASGTYQAFSTMWKAAWEAQIKTMVQQCAALPNPIVRIRVWGV